MMQTQKDNFKTLDLLMNHFIFGQIQWFIKLDKAEVIFV